MSDILELWSACCETSDGGELQNSVRNRATSHNVITGVSLQLHEVTGKYELPH